MARRGACAAITTSRHYRGQEAVTRILLVDGHADYRRQLHALLVAEPGLEVVGEATALRLVEELEPDVVLMEVVMPEPGGFEATRRILAARPEVRLIALSLHCDPAFVRGMFAAGASRIARRTAPSASCSARFAPRSKGAPRGDECT